MYWLSITVSAEIMYLLSEKTYVHRKNIPQDTDPGIGIRNLLVIRYRMAYAASHLVERWKLVSGNVSVINEFIAEVTYHSGKDQCTAKCSHRNNVGIGI